MPVKVISFLKRLAPSMEWRCRRGFLVWSLTPLLAAGLVVLALFKMNPQSSRVVYIFQSMFTDRGGPHPWGDAGPRPPANYTGVWYRWHWNGRLSYEEHYLDGKLDGAFRGWDRLGRQWLEASYRAGQRHGDYVLFYENGVKAKVENYFDGKPAGHWLHFDVDGKKCEERFFSAPGIPDGEETVWNSDGVVLFHHTWNKGKPWEGQFSLGRGTNLFQEVYHAGELLSTTNLGPIPLWADVPMEQPDK